MGDLKSARLIVFKGLAFLFIAAASGALILLEAPTVQTAALVILLAWGSSRFYYFLFYVLERYVDSSLRYAGILALLRALRDRRGSRR